MDPRGLTERLPLGPFSPKQAATTADEVSSLGISLGPALHEACGGHVGHIEWFRSPWQRSGAATGRTHWRLPNGEMIPAIVKAPVGFREYFWTTRLGGTDPMWFHGTEASHLPVPRVFQSGTELGGYDFAWVVIERVTGSPLTHRATPAELRLMFEAAAKFHQAAAEVQPVSLGRPEDPPDWAGLLERAETRAVQNDLCSTEMWRRAIGGVRRKLAELEDTWNERPMETWCHGDLHPGNMMLRTLAESERAGGAAGEDEVAGVLIDFALVRVGAWFEDALYIERVHRGYERLLGGVEPLTALAAARERLGLPSDLEPMEPAIEARRLLTAAVAPAFDDRSDDGPYLAACLGACVTGLGQ